MKRCGPGSPIAAASAAEKYVRFVSVEKNNCSEHPEPTEIDGNFRISTHSFGMETQDFRYGEIKKLMADVVYRLDEAGYSKEATAMSSLTHIIASRIEPPDVSSRWQLEYMLECIGHHNSLLKYINDGATDGMSQM